MTENQLQSVKEKLYKEYWFCKHIQDIEDAAQSGLLDAVKYKANTIAYAYKAAKNHLFPTKKKKTVALITRFTNLYEIPSDNDRTTVSENIDYLNTCLSRISEHSRSLLIDRYLNDMTIEAMAEKYGFKTDSMYGILSRAREELKGEYYAEN